MDSIPDLSPVNDQHQPYPASPTTNGAHPPYSDMIVAAIVGLKDKDGSSRQAIAKYIERHYTNLPPTHSNLLTHHLKRMKNEGQLTIVKHSYMLPLPRSVPFETPAPASAPTPTPTPTLDHDIADYSVTSTDTFGTTAGFKADNSSVQPRRKPGRPPKPRHEFGFQVQNQVPDEQPATEIQAYEPEFEQHLGSSGQELQGNYAGAAEPIFASLGLGDDGVESPEKVVVSAKRGRGRPPKSSRAVVTSSGSGGGSGEAEAERRVRRKVGRPKLMSIMLFNGGGNGIGIGKKRGVGRPKRIGRPVTVPLSGNVMRPRGRPRRAPAPNVSVNANGADIDIDIHTDTEAASVSRARGRPRKPSDTDAANKLLNSTSQSFGWPTEFVPGTSVLVTDPQQLVAFQELKSKYEHLQLKAREVLNVARPYININSEYAAFELLQDLETLLGMDTP